jgi:hypothetical protein
MNEHCKKRGKREKLMDPPSQSTMLKKKKEIY